MNDSVENKLSKLCEIEKSGFKYINENLCDIAKSLRRIVDYMEEDHRKPKSMFSQNDIPCGNERSHIFSFHNNERS